MEEGIGKGKWVSVRWVRFLGKPDVEVCRRTKGTEYDSTGGRGNGNRGLSTKPKPVHGKRESLIDYPCVKTSLPPSLPVRLSSRTFGPVRGVEYLCWTTETRL